MAKDVREEADKSLEEIQEEKRPSADNGLSAFAMFTQRQKYKKESYPTTTIPKPVDLWYDDTKNYFGKTNLEGESIVLREKYLKQVPSGSVNSFAVDFVVDAYNDFKKKYVFLNKKNSTGTSFQFLEPTDGWQSAPITYNTYLDSVFELFTNNFLSSNQREQQLFTFEDFISLFKKFLKYSEGNIPITFSNFMFSNKCSPKSSGLTIEITDDPYSNDLDKYNNFIKNINFECYSQTALEFGFRIDKNFPGRLVADVKSPVMQSYMANYPKEPAPFQVPKPNEPDFNPPKIDRLPTDGIWKKDDVVEIVIVRPKDDDQPFYILREYTDPQNRIFGAGVRPQFSDLDGDRVNEYEYLVDNMLAQGRATKLFLRVVNPNLLPPPTNTQATSTGGPGVANSVVNTQVNQTRQNTLLGGVTTAEGATQPTPPQTAFNPLNKWGQIIGVENSFPGNVEGFMPGAGSYFASPNNRVFSSMSFEKLLGPSPFQSTVSYEYRIDTDGNYYLNMPYDAIHLSNAVQQPTATIERINDYFNQEKRVEKQELEQIQYRTQIYEPLYDQYLNEFQAWQNLSSSVAIEREEFFKDPAPLTFDTFVNKRYNKCYRLDINMLKELIMQFYYSYSAAKPDVLIKEVVRCGGNTIKTKRRVVKREQIYREKIDLKYGAKFWIRNYIEIKNLERTNKINPGVLKNITRNAVTLYENVSEEKSLKYITEQFKKLD